MPTIKFSLNDNVLTMNIKIQLIFFLFIIFSLSAKAQDEIWLLNGQKMTVSDLEFSEDNLTIRYKNEKGKTKLLSTKELFSATPAGDREYIYFKATSEMSLDNMKEYMNGEADATINYKSKGAFWTGLGIGLASPFALGKLSPIIPIAFSLTLGQVAPKPTKLNIETNSDNYIKGYQQVAKRKRLVNSLIGGGIGLVGGLTSVYLINN